MFKIDKQKQEIEADMLPKEIQDEGLFFSDNEMFARMLQSAQVLY